MHFNQLILLQILVLIFLILISGFFSASETGMMSLNRYRIRHLARKGDTKGLRVLRLLERPDRLLGVILIGNTFANILAASVATMVTVKYFGDAGALLATIVLTLIVLIFAETTPKTLAALYPEKISYPASYILALLLKIFYPLVWSVNIISNGILHLLRVPFKQIPLDPLSAEELRTVVHEAGVKISKTYQQMLLRILDLEKVLVEDIMVPRNEIYGIDLDQSWDDILNQLMYCEHAHVPLFYDNIDRAQGMLTLRKVLIGLQKKKLTKEGLIDLAEEIYYVPEAVSASRQLLNFQQHQKSIGLVVDEYGQIEGLITLQDILEEIVGEFASDIGEVGELIRVQEDGSYLVSGGIEVRDLNRITGWELPIEGPRTLSGLIIEYLEMIPVEGIAARIAGYPMEVLQVKHNIIQLAQIWPKFKQKKSDNDL